MPNMVGRDHAPFLEHCFAGTQSALPVLEIDQWQKAGILFGCARGFANARWRVEMHAYRGARQVVP